MPADFPSGLLSHGGLEDASGIGRLIELFARLPGFGPRSARRAVLYLLLHRDDILVPLSDSLRDASAQLRFCSLCGNIDMVQPCSLCRDTTRRTDVLCVVETVADLWAVERARIYKGRYFVLGGTLSALAGKDPESLGCDRLVDLVRADNVKEVVLATNATLEGQTTAHYLEGILEELDVVISRLGHGLPFGGELDYLDETTLAAAFSGRR